MSHFSIFHSENPPLPLTLFSKSRCRLTGHSHFVQDVVVSSRSAPPPSKILPAFHHSSSSRCSTLLLAGLAITLLPQIAAPIVNLSSPHLALTLILLHFIPRLSHSHLRIGNGVVRKRTQAPKLLNPKRKRSRSKQEEEDDYSDTCCEKCGLGQHPSELLLCDKCDCGFHLFCLRPILVAVPEGRWFCPSCSDAENPADFPLVQTKIVDFFRIQRSSQPVEKFSPDSKKKRR